MQSDSYISLLAFHLSHEYFLRTCMDKTVTLNRLEKV
jgi:hypothetical protein